MSCILAVKLGFRARAGHHIHVAVDIRGIYVALSIAWREQKDHLPIATFV
jgi:hypothetical protein